jgi:hypothetical protein
MLVMTDRTGITVKNTIDDADHVRIGVTRVTFWVNGEARTLAAIQKPHVEHTVNDLQDMLTELNVLRQLMNN